MYIVHTKKVRYSEVMLPLHSVETVYSSVERGKNMHANVETVLKKTKNKPSQI